jgi:hypothetical protein
MVVPRLGAILLGSLHVMQAQYVMKVQVIKAKDVPPRFYVNIPLPLAAALDLEGGEAVQWQLLTRSDLRLLRLAASPAKPRRKK